MFKKAFKEIPVYFIIPIVIIAALVPLIVHLKVINLDSVAYQFWTGDKQNTDFFSYYKAVSIIIFSALAVLACLIAKFKGFIELKPQKIYYIPVISYALLVILSTALSKYPITSCWGFADRYEGVFVLLSYMVILYVTINIVNSEKLMGIIIAGLFLSAVILGTVGIFQFFGMDFFQSAAGKIFLLPDSYRNLNLKFTFGANTIYSTLYNTNYVGSYTAMLFPISLAAFLNAEKLYYKIVTGIISCLMFANWVGCGSRAGYIGCFIAIIFLAVLLRKLIIKNIKAIALLLISFLLIFIGMDSFAGGQLTKRIMTTLSGINDYAASQKAVLRLRDIEINGNKVSIICDKNTLNMEIDGYQLLFLDTQGNRLKVRNNDGNIIFDDKGYDPYKISVYPDNNMIKVAIQQMNFNLFIDKSGFKIIGQRGEMVDKIVHPKSYGFEGHERFASSRGYIWSRSIPLLADNIFIGGGPDTYVYQFPQDDYVGKIIALDTSNEIVDKPHNMYLQIGINTGILSLIAILFLFIVYTVSSIRLYFNANITDVKRRIGIALFCAVVGYIVAGLANDSLVSVAPVFWVILGMGISCNYMVGKINTDNKTAH